MCSVGSPGVGRKIVNALIARISPVTGDSKVGVDVVENRGDVVEERVETGEPCLSSS